MVNQVSNRADVGPVVLPLRRQVVWCPDALMARYQANTGRQPPVIEKPITTPAVTLILPGARSPSPPAPLAWRCPR